MNYLLDTNIFLTLVRNPKFATYFYKQYPSSQNRLLTSVVVEGELKSFIMKRDWGTRKRQDLYDLLNDAIIYPIKTDAIIEKYAEIDAFSQGKHSTTLLPTSARNMGKNDIWIAATASVLNATLLTTDKDFDHLKGIFLVVIWVDIKTIV